MLAKLRYIVDLTSHITLNHAVTEVFYMIKKALNLNITEYTFTQ